MHERGPLVPLGDGQTPLSEEDSLGLKLTSVTTRGQLNDFEQRNIARALRRRRPSIEQLLDDLYLRRLHAAMFGDVWTWAGKYRTSDTNIGVDWRRIPEDVRNLVLDARYWVDAEEPDWVAMRFHHRLVAIHPFPNGNGRHGRVVADYMVSALGRPVFTWGAKTGLATLDARRAYLQALRAADAGPLDGLVEFARS